MRRSNSENVGTVIQQILRQQGFETPLNQHRLISSWPEVMGEGINRYTRDIYIQNQTLHVRLSSSIVRNELMMQRQTLVDKLNNAVGSQVITDIMFN